MAKQSKAKIKAKSKNGKKPKESFWNLPFRLYSTQHKAQIISAEISFENEDKSSKISFENED